MSPAPKQPRPTLPARGSGVAHDGHHTCIRCPVCATETCKVLQDLGMYCETQCSASEARAAEKSGKRRRTAA
jgi:hypothetical protein